MDKSAKPTKAAKQAASAPATAPEEDFGELEGDDEVEQSEDDEDSNDDMVDEFDEDDMEDSEDEEEEEEEGAVDDHKAKKAKKDEAFGKAFSAIMGSSIKAHAKENPILIRSKKSAKELEDSKLEAKARRLIKMEKKKAAEKDRVKQLVPLDQPEKAREILEQEKKLKKIAQRGAIRMFNAILASQSGARAASEQSILGGKKREEMASEMSKESFLDAVREG